MLMRFVILAFFGICSSSLAAAEVNLYSSRKDVLIVPILEQFEKQTGIEVNLITGKASALMSRIKSEGKASPADLLVTVDAGNLHRAKEGASCKRFRVNFLSLEFLRPFAIHK